MNKKDEIKSKKIINQKSIAKNSLFFLVYNVLNIIFPFISGIYVAHILLPSSIGQVAYAQNIAQYFVILAFLGIPTYGLREISNARADKQELNKVHSELFFINLFSTIFFSAMYLVIIFTVPEFRENLPVFLITGLSIVLNALDNSWLYEGLEEFKFISIRNLAFKTVAFILLFIAVRSENDYLLYAGITVVGTVGNNILNIAFTRRFVKFQVKNLNFKRHLKPIFLLVAVNLAIEIYSLVDTTMLGIFCPDENIAFYAYGSKINRIFLQIINTFTIVIVPRLSFYYKEKKYEEFNDILTSTFKIVILLAVPLLVGIQFVGEFFICKVYGDVYINSAYVLRILSAILLVSPIGYLLGSRVILSVGKEWKMIVCVGTGAVVNVVGNYFLIQYLKEYGAAISSVASEVVVMLLYIILAKKYFKLNKFWDTVIKVFLSATIMGGYLFGCSFIPLNDWVVFFIQVVGAIILYFLLLLLFKEQIITHALKTIKDKFFINKANNESSTKE